MNDTTTIAQSAPDSAIDVLREIVEYETKSAIELEALTGDEMPELPWMAKAKAVIAAQPPAAPVTDGSVREGDVISYTMTDGVGKVTAHVRPPAAPVETKSDGSGENQPEQRTGPHRASGETNSGATGDSELARSARTPSDTQCSAGKESADILRKFANAYRSGAQGADMDYDVAQRMALAIDDLLDEPQTPPQTELLESASNAIGALLQWTSNWTVPFEGEDEWLGDKDVALRIRDQITSLLSRPKSG